MAKFYIATSLSRHKEHNLVRDFLLENGHEITYDWTLHGSQKHTSFERLKQIGDYQVTAIRDADAVIVLLPGGKGTHTEFGMALALKKPIFMHSESAEPFVLGDEICAFYCCEPLTKHCGSLHSSLDKIENFLSDLVIA